MTKSRMIEVARFGVIGVLATLVHFVAMNLLVRGGMDPVLANVIGFLTAVGISYTGQSLWVFRQPISDRVRMGKFGVSALFGVLANAAVMTLFVKIIGTHHNVGFIAALIFVPATLYCVNRFWVFRPIEG